MIQCDPLRVVWLLYDRPLRFLCSIISLYYLSTERRMSYGEGVVNLAYFVTR